MSYLFSQKEYEDIRNSITNIKPKYYIENPLHNIDIENISIRIPVILLIDVSGTINPYIKEINDQINFFINSINKGINFEKYSIDLSIITFSNTINIFRHFNTVSEMKDDISITEGEGMTPLGSALLLAYQYSEKRKNQYKDKKVDYRQPIFLILSDFDDNDKTKIEGILIYKYICEKLTILSHNKKIGIVKAPIGHINDVNFKLLDVPQIKNDEFVNELQKFFAELLSSVKITTNGYYIDDYDSDPDEDDILGKGTLNDDETLADYLQKLFTVNQ